MTDPAAIDPISETALDEHWFSLRLKTWRAVAAAVKTSGVEQKKLADRIAMDPAQFNKVITGKTSNVTLRTLHNIARAANHRLKITLEPLSDLPKPNYSYEASKPDVREGAVVFRRTTDTEPAQVDSWQSSKRVETAGADAWQ